MAQKKGWSSDEITLLHEAAMQVSSKKGFFGDFEHKNELPSKCRWEKEGWEQSGLEMTLTLVRDKFELMGGDTSRFDSDITISSLDAMWKETYEHARTFAPANSDDAVIIRIFTKCI